jgi:hypothetical protein
MMAFIIFLLPQIVKETIAAGRKLLTYLYFLVKTVEILGKSVERQWRKAKVSKRFIV